MDLAKGKIGHTSFHMALFSRMTVWVYILPIGLQYSCLIRRSEFHYVYKKLAENIWIKQTKLLLKLHVSLNFLSLE